VEEGALSEELSLQQGMVVMQVSSRAIPRRRRQPASSAYAFQYLYPLWIPVWFVAQLETASAIRPSPSPVTGAGVAGMAAALVLAALLPLPSWLGAGVAARSARRGDGPAATMALRWNVLVGVLLLGVLWVFGG
jgi:hypothetical protein